MTMTLRGAESPDRLAPQATEAEQSVLGSILVDRDAILRVADFLRPVDFYRQQHADIYEGFFPARRMPGERFEINEVESALIGMRTGERVGIGDAIEVRVESVEPARGRVDLVAAGDDRDDRPRRRTGRGRGRR